VEEEGESKHHSRSFASGSYEMFIDQVPRYPVLAFSNAQLSC